MCLKLDLSNLYQKIFLLWWMVFYVAVAGCTGDKPETFSGLPGGIEGASVTAGPSANPASWFVLPEPVLKEEDKWGIRANPRSVFKIPGGLGLMYTSHPGEQALRDPQWLQQRFNQGLMRAGMASIAFSSDLVNWRDYPGNPVLEQIQQPWQSPHRIALRDLLFDPVEERWVVYFIDAGGNFTGVRAIGAAESKDLINWRVTEAPLITIDDYKAAVPERISATEAELQEHGRVYFHWSMYYGGRFYIVISGTDEVGYTEAEGIRSTAFSSMVMVGDSPLGPFEALSEVPVEHILPGNNRPVYQDGKWYTVYTGVWDGLEGFGLAWSDSLFGPFTKNPLNPIIGVESTSATHPLLLQYDGIWAVLFSRGSPEMQGHPLRLAVSHLHPALIGSLAD